ncbi:hypothetical protein KQI63_16940 [bacterium]|nr:hypothetical protein [bacterium]
MKRTALTVLMLVALGATTLFAAPPPPEELYGDYASAGWWDMDTFRETDTPGLNLPLKITANAASNVEDPSYEYLQGEYYNGSLFCTIVMTRTEHDQHTANGGWWSKSQNYTNVPADYDPFIISPGPTVRTLRKP